MQEISPPAPERLLVCVGPGNHSADVIRAAKKMAAGLKAVWFAVYVKTPKMVRLSDEKQNRAVQNLQLAEQLGAQTFTLFSRNLAEKIGDFAHRHNITRIIVGKPNRHRWFDIMFGSNVDEFVRLSSNIDVYFITGETKKLDSKLSIFFKTKKINFLGYGMGLLYTIVATGFGFLIYPYFDMSNLIMVYLLGVMLSAIHWGRGPASLNAFLSVIAFYFFFVPVRYSFTLAETHFIFTFAVMLTVALVISHLVFLIQGQAEAAHLQERQTTAMHALSRQLSTCRGIENIIQVAIKQIGEVFECQVAALLPEEDGTLMRIGSDLPEVAAKNNIKEKNIAKWAFRTGQMAGWGTTISPESAFLYIPLQATKAVIGVLALRLKDPATELWLLPEHLRLNLLNSLAKQVALALEVERLEHQGLALSPVPESGAPRPVS